MSARLKAFLVGSSIMISGVALAQSGFVVHLPSAPIESASRLAEAVASLSDYLEEQVPGLQLELQLFRRWSDANDYLEKNRDRVALVLTDASFLLDRSSGLVPAHRFRRAGGGTYRRVVIVRRDSEQLHKLVDLQGRALQVVETSGPSGMMFLERAVFDGEVTPLKWFGKVESQLDDFKAVNNVLYGQADAALVAAHNPLLATHLGSDLRTIYTSPPLSLPVLAVRDSLFQGENRRFLDRALSRAGDHPLGRKALEELGLEGFDSLLGIDGVVALPTSGDRELEVALPSGDLPTLSPPTSPLPAEELLFTISIELPDIPLPRTNRESENE